MRRLSFIDAHHHRDPNEGLTISFAGIHPWDADKVDLEAELRRVEQSTTDYDAVGEIGLDFVCPVARERQEEVFVRQLALAQRLGRMVVIHSVKSFERTLEILADYKLPAVILHGFIGSLEQMQRAAKRGYFLSFGERTLLSKKTLRAFCAAPDELILVESDTSDRDIWLIYRDLAEARGCSLDELRNLVFSNYKRIFNAKQVVGAHGVALGRREGCAATRGECPYCGFGRCRRLCSGDACSRRCWTNDHRGR